eukprot:gene11812-15808_t
MPGLEMPFYADETDFSREFEDTFGIIVTFTHYPDKCVFSIPAGKRELGETPWMCAIRETYEEIGLDISASKNPLPESHYGFMCTYLNHFRFGFPTNTNDTYVLNLAVVGENDIPHLCKEFDKSRIVDNFESNVGKLTPVVENNISSNALTDNKVGGKCNDCGTVEKYEGNIGYIKSEKNGMLSFDRREFKQYISRGSRVSFQIVQKVLGEYTVENLSKF